MATKSTAAKKQAGAKSIGSEVSPTKSPNKQIASKAKVATSKQARPAQTAATRQQANKNTAKRPVATPARKQAAKVTVPSAKKAAAAPVTKAAAPVKKAGAKYRRSEIVSMNRVRIVQEAIQQRDLEERELLEIDELS